VSSEALSHVWDIKGVTAEEKLILFWVANNSGGLGRPVMVDPIGMGEFINAHFEHAFNLTHQLAERGLLHWERGSEDWSSYIWLAYDGPYGKPIDWTAETKTRSKRVAALIERDGAQCTYCGCTPVVYEVDHFVPRARGGPDAMDNLVLACAPCNRSKRDKMPEEFLKDDLELYRRIASNLDCLHL
jgi:hypothetical protein